MLSGTQTSRCLTVRGSITLKPVWMRTANGSGALTAVTRTASLTTVARYQTTRPAIGASGVTQSSTALDLANVTCMATMDRETVSQIVAINRGSL